MKYIELQYAFELEIANLDQPLDTKAKSKDIEYWLNQGVDKFIKTRYNGNNIRQTSFEQDEKRTRDLINLTKTSTPEFIEHKLTTKYYVVDSFSYPDDVMFVLDEHVVITYEGDDGRSVAVPVEIFECTLDTYMYRITNKLTDFHLRNGYARPLRVRTNIGADLYTEPSYKIYAYDITYIRKPSKITFSKPFDEYTEFPDYAQNEIVKLAVQMYLENTSSPRYESIINENSQME